MGQGVHTVALQALCTETGIEPNIVELRVDTASGQEAGMTTASRATSLVGNATIDAARKLRADLDVQLVYRFLRDTVWVAVRWYRPGGSLTPADVADQYLTILLEGISHA